MSIEPMRLSEWQGTRSPRGRATQEPWGGGSRLAWLQKKVTDSCLESTQFIPKFYEWPIARHDRRGKVLREILATTGIARAGSRRDRRGRGAGRDASACS